MNLLSVVNGLPFGTILRTLAAVRVFVAKVNKANADGKITLDEWYDLVVGLVLAIGDIFQIRIPTPSRSKFEEEGHGDRAAEAKTVILDDVVGTLKGLGL